jgi:hypothetical protein
MTYKSFLSQPDLTFGYSYCLTNYKGGQYNGKVKCKIQRDEEEPGSSISIPVFAYRFGMVGRNQYCLKYWLIMLNRAFFK